MSATSRGPVESVVSTRGAGWRILLVENLPFLGLFALYGAAWLVVSPRVDLPNLAIPDVSQYAVRLLEIFLEAFLPMALLTLLLLRILDPERTEPVRPWPFVRDVGRRYLTPRVAGGGLLLCLVHPLFLHVFRLWKTSIPAFQDYVWDGAFAALDRGLHFGRHPWEWIQAAVPGPGATIALDGIYSGWFELQLAVVAWMAFTLRRRLRLRFFVTYALIYIVLGTVLAILLASGGPVYYARLTGLADPYVPLFSYLDRVSELTLSGTLFARSAQGLLWSAHEGTYSGPVTGISAMPSIHVAIAVLHVCVATRVSRVLSVILAGVALLTFVGSVHLGWHYAIDGYLSAVLVVLLWWGVGRAMERWGWRVVPEVPRPGAGAPSSGAGEPAGG